MKEKVLLGMSGGVDSSTSALILKKEGYEVIGITLNLLENNAKNSNIDDAKKVCEYLNIPHYTSNMEKEFNSYVINDFVNCYQNCKTPNPCVECNRYLKFGLMWEKAKELRLRFFSNRTLC